MDAAARNVLRVAGSVLSDMDLESVLQRVLEAACELTGARHAALGSLVHDHGPLCLAASGAGPPSYGLPAEHQPMSSFLGMPIFVAGEPYGNLYLTDKLGAAQFEAEDEEVLVLLARFAGVAIDHARRFTGSEAHREELQRTVQVLNATMQITRAVAGETDVDVILELVAKRSRALVSARTVLIEHRRGDELVVAAGAGELPPGLIGQRDSIAGTVLHTAVTQRLEDEPDRLCAARYGLGRLGFHASAGLVVPLVFGGQAHGALIAVDRLTDGPAFSADDQRLLESFATSAAAAIATAHTVDIDRRSRSLAATEQEREHWARELHDETLQNLAAVRLALAAANRLDDPDAIADAVPAAIDQLDADIASLRSLITDLRPAELSLLGPHVAIDALAQRSRRNGLQVRLRVELAYEQGRAAGRLLAELETATYRITQEALTNAHKHGHARNASVEIIEDHAAVRVTVQDDGRGFDPAGPTDGFGLLGMRERAELLGGTLTITSAPGDGTTVMAVLPVHR